MNACYNRCMTQVTLDEIQKDVSGYIHRVEAGETLVVMDSNRPVAEIRPVETPAKTPRPIGLAAGEFVVPDEFFDPLPEDILKGFEGE